MILGMSEDANSLDDLKKSAARNAAGLGFETTWRGVGRDLRVLVTRIMRLENLAHLVVGFATVHFAFVDLDEAVDSNNLENKMAEIDAQTMEIIISDDRIRVVFGAIDVCELELHAAQNGVAIVVIGSEIVLMNESAHNAEASAAEPSVAVASDRLHALNALALGLVPLDDVSGLVIIIARERFKILELPEHTLKVRRVERSVARVATGDVKRHVDARERVHFEQMLTGVVVQQLLTEHLRVLRFHHSNDVGVVEESEPNVRKI